MIKFVVIKKYSKNHVYFKNSKKKNFVELLNRYGGFEGDCLYYRQTDNIKELENIINEAQKLINNLNYHECFLLLCSNIILSEQIKNKLYPRNFKIWLCRCFDRSKFISYSTSKVFT